MAAPQILKWSDTDAPQISSPRDITQWTNWFTKIFRDGYGSQYPIGQTLTTDNRWSYQYDAASKNILLTPYSTGYTINPGIRFNFDYACPSSGTSYAPYIVIGVAETWTNITTPVNSIITSITSRGIGFGAQYNLPVTTTLYTLNDKAIPWIVVGTGRTFYWIWGSNYTTNIPTIPTILSDSTTRYVLVNYFGDYTLNPNINSFNHNQVYTRNIYSDSSQVTTQANIICDEYATYSLYNLNHSIGTNFPQFVVSKDVLGNYGIKAKSYDYRLNNPYGSSDTQTVGYSYGNNEELFLHPIRITASNRYMGKLKGAYYNYQHKPLAPLANVLGGYGIFQGSNGFSGTDFMVISDNTGEVYIDLTGDWDS